MNFPAPTPSPNPAEIVSSTLGRSPTPHGEVDRGRPDTIRSFAFFSYKGEERLEKESLSQRAWSDALYALAELAEEEDWTGAGAGERPLPILDSYIRYTYQRLVMEKKLAFSEDGEFAALNTGLLSRHHEDILGLFQRNDHPGAQPWYFKRWATESDRDILGNFEALPDMASYVSTASDLVYDLGRVLRPAYVHILEDNLDRFPPEVAAMPGGMRRAVVDRAIDLTLKRTRRNFKTVVPQWYPKSQEAGFLLPLDLLGRGQADLALVVSEASDTTYRGHTVLTLEMAYTVARLVSRPDSDWLKPHAMSSDSEDQDL